MGDESNGKWLPVIGDMPSGWKIAEFGELLNGGTRNGIYKKKEFHGRGTRIVNMGELFGNPRLFDVEMKRVELTESDLGKALIQPGDLLFARRSLVAEGAGKCIVVCEVPEPTTFESSIIRACPDPFKVDSLYLYYLFNSPFGQYSLGTIRRTVAVSGITGTDLVTLPLPIPPLAEQRRISSILGTLDDKIELNRKMNTTLESMAQAMFKSWFVDFDPVIDNALAAGNPIPEPLQPKAQTRQALPSSGDKKPTLPPDIQKLFPDSFQFDEELGWIPEGWEIVCVSEHCKIVQNGGTPRRGKDEYWNDGDIPWLTSGEVRQPIITGVENFITKSGLENSSAKWLPAGSTVVAMYGATAGQVAFAAIPLTTNQAVCGLVPNANFTYFNYLFLSRNEDALLNQARGSAQQNINKGIVEQSKTIKPTEKIAIEFNKRLNPVFLKIVCSINESRTLAKLRDTLLPKLLSGELRIPDAEKLVAEHV